MYRFGGSAENRRNGADEIRPLSNLICASRRTSEHSERPLKPGKRIWKPILNFGISFSRFSFRCFAFKTDLRFAHKRDPKFFLIAATRSADAKVATSTSVAAVRKLRRPSLAVRIFVMLWTTSW
jgi:hypothetical protein